MKIWTCGQFSVSWVPRKKGTNNNHFSTSQAINYIYSSTMVYSIVSYRDLKHNRKIGLAYDSVLYFENSVVLAGITKSWKSELEEDWFIEPP